MLEDVGCVQKDITSCAPGCVLPCLESFGYSFCCCSGGGEVGTLGEEELALKCIGEYWECTAGGGRLGAVDEQRDDLHILDFLIFRQHSEMYKKSSFEKGGGGMQCGLQEKSGIGLNAYIYQV
jgi:hypothetical protein